MTIAVAVNSPSPSPQTPVSSIASPTSPQSNPSTNSTTNDTSTSTANTSSNNNNTSSSNDGNPPAKRKASRRANTAERRATHNAVERQRRETLNGRFLDLAALLPNLATVRRPSKSAIVNSSIALIHSHRRARALAGRELRALDEETHALRREINEWRARARSAPGSGLPHLPPLQSPQRSTEFLALISESTNIDDKIVEEEERRAYMLAEGAPGDGDYDPEDSDDVNGGDCWTSPSSSNPSHNDVISVSAGSLPPPQPTQTQWQAAAALQMQYAQAQALQQAQAQALQQAQMQTMVGNSSIGNVGMNAGLMAMGMPANNVGPLGLVGVGSLGQGQSPNAPTWSAHPSFPHSPIDAQPNPFAFTMSGNGMTDFTFHNHGHQQQQQYQAVMHQSLMNGTHNGFGGNPNSRTPPSTTASVSSPHEDDLSSCSPRSMGSTSSGADNASVASTPSPVVSGRQMNGSGNRNINRNINMNNMNMNPSLSSGPGIGSMKTGWGLVGPHNIPNAMTTNSSNIMSLGGGGGGGGMGVVSVAGMMI